MKESTTKFYLGFDFGTKRIGVAVGQKLTGTATPLAKISTKNGEPRWEKILELIKKWKPIALVVGVPLNIDGTPQPITATARKFIEKLKIHANLPVYAAEERLTTKSAREKIFTAGGYKALQEESTDSFAAKIILEEWMSEAHGVKS